MANYKRRHQTAQYKKREVEGARGLLRFHVISVEGDLRHESVCSLPECFRSEPSLPPSPARIPPTPFVAPSIGAETIPTSRCTNMYKLIWLNFQNLEIETNRYGSFLSLFSSPNVGQAVEVMEAEFRESSITTIRGDVDRSERNHAEGSWCGRYPAFMYKWFR